MLSRQLALQDEIYQAFEDYQSGRLQNPADNPWVGTGKAQAAGSPLPLNAKYATMPRPGAENQVY